MFAPLLLAVVLSPSPSCSCSAYPPAVSVPFSHGVEDPIVDKREEVKDLLAELKQLVGAGGKEDVLAVKAVGKLAVEFKKSGPKDQSAIVKEFGRCLSLTRRNEAGTLPDNKLQVPVAKALGNMGEGATGVLVKWIGSKKHRENLVLQREMIGALGLTKDLDGLKTLQDLLHNNSNSVVVWAAQALGEFEGAPEKNRKKLFADLLEILSTAKTLNDSHIAQKEMRERFLEFDTPFRKALARLCGESFGTPEEYERWWKENRRVSWE